MLCVGVCQHCSVWECVSVAVCVEHVCDSESVLQSVEHVCVEHVCDDGVLYVLFRRTGRMTY